ncbi:MAG: cytochrome C [Desulfurivibrio sp.]|nr:MAG: cytochrome C [Desulfurivibrio sp.]
MKKNRKILYNVLSVFFISSAISCMPINATERGAEVKTGKAEAPMLLASNEQPAAAPAESTAPASVADLYAQTPEPLTVVQCAQCHPSVFDKIKNDGGRHRIDCQDCHQQFHSYNPNKNNWQEIMPKCDQCHTEPPHGTNFLDCMSCHFIPHTPLNVPMNDLLAGQCANCHTGPGGELTQFPSAHTQQGCSTCHHTKHGNIPSCMECHEPHIADQPVEACKSCHPVHRPLEITYEAGTEATCGACHGQVYDVWIASPSKHSGVACAKCHEKHGQIPECTNCHTQPHDQKMLEKFPRCLDCHINAHNPPINKK